MIKESKGIWKKKGCFLLFVNLFYILQDTAFQNLWICRDDMSTK